MQTKTLPQDTSFDMIPSFSKKAMARWQQSLHVFSGLASRGLVSPSFLSTLVMYAVLPAKLNQLIGRNIERDPKDYNETSEHFQTTFFFNGDTETLQIKSISASKNNWTIFFCGNDQDGIKTGKELRRLTSGQSYVYWNYPGTLGSKGNARSQDDLIEAGYQQVKRLLDKEQVHPQQITLHGSSLGGGVATQVAQRLHKEGHPVHLTVDRSFASIAHVVPAWLKQHILLTHKPYLMRVDRVEEIELSQLKRDQVTIVKIGDKNQYLIIGNKRSAYLYDHKHLNKINFPSQFKQQLPYRGKQLEFNFDPYQYKTTLSPYTPLMTSVVSLSAFGVSLGATCAGFISSVGLIAATSTMGVSLCLSSLVHLFGFILEQVIYTLGECCAFLFQGKTKQFVLNWFKAIAQTMSYPFKWSARKIADCLTLMSTYLNTCLDFVGSVAGGFVLIAGVISGALIGLVIGAFLSLQCLWTKEPLAMPMLPAFSLATAALCCRMDSVSAMKNILKRKNEKTDIQIINTMDDDVIPVEAALNTGLGFKPGKKQPHSFWHHQGGHGGKIHRPVLDKDNLYPVLDDSDLVLATEQGHLNILKKLVELGENPGNSTGKETPLFIATARGHIDIVRYLLSQLSAEDIQEISFLKASGVLSKAPLSYESHDAISAFMRIREEDKSLLKYGGDIPISPLQFAVLTQQPEIVDLLKPHYTPEALQKEMEPIELSQAHRKLQPRG